MSQNISAEEGCFNYLLKKGHTTQYAKDFLYNTKLSVFGNMTHEGCVKELLRKKSHKD